MTPSPPRTPGGNLLASHQLGTPADWTAGEVSPSYKAWPRSSGAVPPPFTNRKTLTSPPSRTAPRTRGGPPPPQLVLADAVRYYLAWPHAGPSRPPLFPDDANQPPRPHGPKPRSPRPAPSPRAPWPRPLPSRKPPGDLRCTASPPFSPTWHHLPLNTIRNRRPALPAFRLVQPTPTAPASGRPIERSASATSSGRALSEPGPRTTQIPGNEPTRESPGELRFLVCRGERGPTGPLRIRVVSQPAKKKKKPIGGVSRVRFLPFRGGRRGSRPCKSAADSI